MGLPDNHDPCTAAQAIQLDMVGWCPAGGTGPVLAHRARRTSPKVGLGWALRGAAPDNTSGKAFLAQTGVKSRPCDSDTK
jgi:hypothetical protein